MERRYNEAHRKVAEAVADAAFAKQPIPIAESGDAVQRVDETLLPEIDFSTLDRRLLAIALNEVLLERLIERVKHDANDMQARYQLTEFVRTTFPELHASARAKVMAAHDVMLFRNSAELKARKKLGLPKPPSVELCAELAVDAYFDRARPRIFEVGPPKMQPAGCAELSKSRQKLADKARRRRKAK